MASQTAQIFASALWRTSQQLKQPQRGALRAIRIPDAVPAAFAAQRLAQQLTGAKIKQPHEPRSHCTFELQIDPTTGVVGSFHFDTVIKMNPVRSRYQ